ncbi:ubiquitin carboxyl-terminal hydrolase family protein (macronuclear) [Tetrahymena thermophila SB210]|uniref:Ubiquitin carboxyl-terminal hydrolase family protein n=1 Tax=Tetrahymena thermophila (strain SB210) TaxID=312017 RepID=Q23U27_TETTS|nr:ubiquitin carboxyl-terminal hydrolase family protein [Tetrahymena thermophila SB210]EAS00023.2 ubiquitin carboxyl-terminal hydrolase family protein [Tetrahymena thermophila SB210]|eukprot:XP_001020268.2 ubiquitin carboxyl-terminal hydrolase family protein [Tetrahymena thermophila SB210]
MQKKILLLSCFCIYLSLCLTDNCNQDKQFVDSNNICHTCSGNTPFINYDDSIKNGTCVGKCNEGLYYNSTSYCVKCQNGFPSYNQTSCLGTCDQGGQILNLNGTACIYKENCTQLISQNNGTSQCVSNCNSNRQFVDLTNKICYTCSGNTTFINYDDSNKNGTCVGKCNEGLYYNSTSYCVKCQNGFPSYNQTSCLGTCDQGGQILNLSGDACIYKENCTQFIAQTNSTAQCVGKCNEGLYYNSTSYCLQCQNGYPSYNQTSCLGTCDQGGQILNLSGNACIYKENCTQLIQQNNGITQCVSTCDQGGQILNLNGNACIYKENCTQLISQNNGTTQCVSNCNSNRQFVDLTNKICYTCSGNTTFINYDDTNKNGTCVGKCNEGLYYNSTSFCVKCQKGFPFYDQTSCLDTCEQGGQILNLSGNACIYKENCTQLIQQNNGTTQCVSKCNEGLYYNSTNYCVKCQNGFPSYNQTSCYGTCDQGQQILNLNGNACIYKENCTQFIAQTNGTIQCVGKCNEGLYYSSNKLCLQCQNGFPSYNQTSCLGTCDQGGQILNLNGNACIYKENCTQQMNKLFVNQNNMTQCTATCSGNRQYLNQTNFCITCNNSQYINVKNNILQCVSNCDDNQFVNSTSYCNQCNQNQYVSSNGTVCVNSCNNSEFISLSGNRCLLSCPLQQYQNVNKTACVSSCGIGEYVDQSNGQKQCKVCSNYLQVDTSNQEVQCLNQCSQQQLIYYFTYNQVKYKQCVNPTFCKSKKISASNSNICTDTCISPEIDNGSSTCSLNCSQGQYQFPSNSTCSSTCQNYISSDNKLCIESCGQVLEVVGSENRCSKCQPDEYFSLKSQQGCVKISNTTESLTQLKNSVIQVISTGINTVQALQKVQEQINQYTSQSYDLILSNIQSKSQTTTEDKQQIQQAVNDIFTINQSLVSKISTSQGKQSVVTGSSQLKVIGQTNQPGYKFSQILNSSDIQNGNTTSLLEQDTNLTSSQQPQVLQIAYVSTNMYCQQYSCAQKQPLFLLNVKSVQSQQRILQQSQSFQIMYAIKQDQNPNKLICQNYNEQGVLTWSQGQVQNGQIACQISYSSSIYYDEQCLHVDQKYCDSEDESTKGLSGVQIFGITFSCIAFVGITSVCVISYIRRKKNCKKFIQLNQPQALQANNLITEQGEKIDTENQNQAKKDEAIILDQIALE